MNKWKKYRKKPVTIRAYQWNGDTDNIVRPYPHERFSTGFEECSRCGRKASLHVKTPHPLNRHQAVLNALDRHSKKPDAIFTKKYFRSFKGLARTFYLKETNNNQP